MPTNFILVVGGAGFIGSHMVLALKQAGLTPIVLDNLSTGHADAVSAEELIIGDMADVALLDAIFAKYRFAAVMHFASFIEVGESVKDPLKYYQNNVGATLVLLKAMHKWRVTQFIFSSTAAVYGEPRYTPIDEAHPTCPINPYGHSKKMIEQMLEDFSRAYDFRFISLRYFNAAGADPEGRAGERHEPESHLIPLVLQVASGKRDKIAIFGTDYPTTDGTCVRDYIHVTDLCSAHLLALQALNSGKPSAIYNLGTGQGYSVQSVIDTARQITQHPIPTFIAPPRPGDPAVLVANANLAMQALTWKPLYSSLEKIISSAWHYQLIGSACES